MYQFILSMLFVACIAAQADQNNPDLDCGCKTQRDQMSSVLLDYAKLAHQDDAHNPDLDCDSCGKTETDSTTHYKVCDIPINVTPEDIAPGGVAGGYTITQPGCYVLSDNVSITSFTGGHAVTIEADDVTFDLNGKTITRLNGFGGCIISTTHNTLTVENGSISQFNNGPLHFIGCDTVLLDQLQILDSQGSFAAFFNSCTNCTVTNSNFNNGLFNPTGIVTVVGFVSTYAPSSNHRIENCSINNNITTTASLVIGLLMSDSPFSVIKNCHVNNNNITKADMQAIYINRGNSCSIEQCEVSNNTCVNGFFDGIFINFTTNTTITDSSVTFNHAQVGTLNGIFLNQSISCLIQNCNVDGNLIVNPISAARMTGIRLGSFDGPVKLVCSNCTVDHNIVNENKTNGSGISRGIYALDDCTSSNAITNNTVTNNTSTTTSIGIDLDGGTNASGNIVSGHTIN